GIRSGMRPLENRFGAVSYGPSPRNLVNYRAGISRPSETLDIAEGSKLKCVNCFVKQTDFGIDISKGRKGTIEKI
ncbi:MAG: hypothetical protein ABR986_12030, partial [Methanomassiliicoccales archaeon]